jgi:O-Antigen ligase
MNWSGVFSDQKGRRQWDWHVVLFFLNVFLVVYGYNLRGADFQVIKVFRTVLVSISLGGLFLLHGPVKYGFEEAKNWVLWVFLLICFLVTPFSINFFWSLERLFAWIPFIVYVNYFIIYLFTKYDKDEAKIKLLQVFGIAYVFPVSLLFYYGIVFGTENIYGQNVGLYKANVVGWACTIFLITSFDLYSNLPMSRWLRNLFFGVSIFVLWGIVLTGSRSSYISLAAVAAVLVLRSSLISKQLKLVVLICICGFGYYIITSPDSVINLRAQYADIRNQRTQIRFDLMQSGFKAFSSNPTLFFTGFGFDNFREGLLRYAGVKTELASHNSYLEIFFGTGVISFVFFLIFMVANAILKFVRFDSRQYTFLPALLIIPYFESNLNAGQFLFFPWMTMMFYYVHVTSLQVPLSEVSAPRKKLLGWQN